MELRAKVFALVAVLFLSVAAHADTTPAANCTRFPVTFADGTGGPTAASCPPFTVPGGTLTGVTLSYSADYQFGSSQGTNSVNVTFVPAGPVGVTWAPPSVTLPVTGGQSSGAIPTGGANATAGVTNAAFAVAFNVNVSSSVVQGTVATSSGAVSVVYTYTPPPAINLTCPPSTGTVGTPYSGSLVATGGVPAYTFSITLGSLPPVLTLNASTGAITGTPTTAGPFSFTAKVEDSTGTPAGTTTASCTITISDIPPPPTGPCATSAATNLIFPTAQLPENVVQVRYASNLDQGDSFVDLSNTGLNGAPLLGPGFGSAVGNVCANVYVFSPDEQLISCCSCTVTPNALVSLSVTNDLISNTLTGIRPTSVVVKVVGSTPGANTLSGGLVAWGTSLHATPAVGTYATSETRFTPSTLSAADLASITGRCASILANGSGYGVCRSCRLGALGAGRQ